MRCHPWFLLLKTWRPFFALSLFIAFTGVSSPPGCHPHLFYLSDLVSPLFFVNLLTIFFLRVSPPGGCHPGRSAPRPLVTPLKITPYVRQSSAESIDFAALSPVNSKNKYRLKYKIDHRKKIGRDDISNKIDIEAADTMRFYNTSISNRYAAISDISKQAI